jgi:hypothetical protein
MAILVSDHNVTIECSNGYAVSLAYGVGSYSSNRDGKAPRTATGAVECTTVEVAVLNRNAEGDDRYVKLGGEGDGICGYCNADRVARLIGAVVEGDLDKANQQIDVLHHNR